MKILRIGMGLGLYAMLVGCATPSSHKKGAEEFASGGPSRCDLPRNDGAAQEGMPWPGVKFALGPSSGSSRAVSLRQFELDRTKSGDVVIFARTHGRTQAEIGATWPAIFSRGKKEWRELSLRKDFEGWEWALVAQDYARARIWGILESAREGGAHELPVIVSRDGGKSWSLQGYIPKPRYTALLRAFKAYPDGSLQATLVLEATECRNFKALPESNDALFSARSSDGGTQWVLNSEVEIVSSLDLPRPAESACEDAFVQGKALPWRCSVIGH